MQPKLLFPVLAALLCATASPPTAWAEPPTANVLRGIGTNGPIDGFIRTNGALWGAANFGSTSNVLRNGVTFPAAGSVGNPAGANWSTVGAAVDSSLGGYGAVDPLFFSEIWGNDPVTLTCANLNPAMVYLVQILHGEPRSCCAGSFTNNDFLTSAGGAVPVPAFALGNGVAGENPPNVLDRAIVEVELTGITSFTYRMKSGIGRGGSIAGFQVRELPLTSVVTSLGDSGPGSLRQAIADSGSGGLISFATNLSGQTILLTNGQILLNRDLVIDASTLPGGIQINGNHASRIFYVETNAAVVMNSLSLVNGLAAGVNGTNAVAANQTGGSGTPGLGGGIYNAGTLTLNQVTLSGDSALGGNGGLGVGMLPGASAPGQGGGIFNGGTLTLNQSTLTGNSASGGTGGNGFVIPATAGSPGWGGGIYNAGTLTLNQATLASDSATGGAGGNGNGAPGGSGGGGLGGGIYNAGTLTLNEATLAGDSATGGTGGNGNNGNPAGGNGGDGLGGGIYNAGTLNLNQTTLAGDSATAGQGGSGFTHGNGASGNSQAGGIYGANPFSIFNTIAAGNSALSDTNIYGSFTATGNNLTNGAPLLAPLGNYGGPTPTMPPLTGSPAINAGSDAATNAPYSFATDQRGLPRRSGQHVDLGAVELVLGPPSITALTAVVIGTNAANGAFTVRLSASVSPNNELATAVYFQYGLTSAYAGTNGPISIGSIYFPYHATNVTAALGFNSGFTYHWNAVAANSAYTNSTPDQTFHLSPPGIPGDLNGDGVVDQSEFAAVLANLHGNGMVSQSDLNLVLSNYWPNSPWLFMTNVAGLGGTNVTFALDNSLVGAYSVEYTTNLADWFPLGPATPRYEFTDTNAPAVPQRYYHLRWP